MSLDRIERLAKHYALDQRALAAAVDDLESRQAELRASHLARIRTLASAAARSKGELEAAVDDGRALFKRPKTRILHGIKVGLVKGKGKLVFANPKTVIARIRKTLPRQADDLIKVSETPDKTALGKLSVRELKALGISIVDAEDQVVVKPTDSEIDKIVAALLDARATGSAA